MMMMTTMMMTSRRTGSLVVGLGGEKKKERGMELTKREGCLGIAKQLESSLQQGWEGGRG